MLLLLLVRIDTRAYISLRSDQLGRPDGTDEQSSDAQTVHAVAFLGNLYGDNYVKTTRGSLSSVAAKYSSRLRYVTLARAPDT